MIIVVIIIVFVIILGGILIGFVLDKKIKEGKIKERAYTRLTMWIMIFSLMSILIMFISLLLNISILEDTKRALKAQAEGIAPINPNLIIKLSDEDYNKFYFYDSIIGLNHNENWTFWPKTWNIKADVRNNGQGETGLVHFYLKDRNNLFSASGVSKEIKPFDFEYIEFSDIRYRECLSGSGKVDYNENKEICNPSNINTGLMEWIIIVDCEPCYFDENPKCYSFKICVYNETQQKDWCKTKFGKEVSVLENIECPLNFL